MTDKERSEEIMDAIAYLRDKYADVEMVSEYYGHDIVGEIVSCPISALSYTGDYIELLHKRVQELETTVDFYQSALRDADRRVQKLENRIADDEHFVAEILEQNKRYREALEFYADEENYITFYRIFLSSYQNNVDEDNGKKARKALEG